MYSVGGDEAIVVMKVSEFIVAAAAQLVTIIEINNYQKQLNNITTQHSNVLYKLVLL